MVYKEILLNITLLVTVSLIYGYVLRYLNVSRKRNQILSGIIFGLIAMLVMTVPVRQATGVIYDSRTIVISIAGLFSGGLSVLIASLIASAYRLWIGGIGTLPGICSIAGAALLGFAAYRLWQDQEYYRNPVLLYGFGLVVTLVMLVCQLLLPFDMALEILGDIWSPVLLFYPLGTVLLGILIADHEHRMRTHRSIRENEKRYRSLFENNHVATWLLDPETGDIVDANQAAANFYGWSRDQLRTMNVAEDINVQAPEAVKNHIRQSWQREDHYYEFQHQIADGSLVDVAIYTGFINLGGKDLLFSHIFDITESKGVQQELRESEEKFRVAFQTSPDAVNLNRLSDGFYIDINEGFTRSTGYTREDTLGKTSLELNIWNNPSDRERLVAGLQQNGVVNNLEAEFVTKDGDVRIGLMSARIMELHGESVIMSVTRDITERKRAERALRKSEERYTRIANTIPGVLYDYKRWPDGRTKFLYISPQCEEIFEYPAVEIMEDANILWNMVHPKDIGRLQEEDRLANETGQMFQSEVRIRPPSGKEKWIQLTSRPSPHKPDTPEIWSGVILDITDQKVAEEAVRESERRYSALMETAPDLIISIDMEGRINYVNSQVEAVLGYKASMVIGKQITDFMQPEDAAITREGLQSRLDGDTAIKSYELSVFNKDGESNPFEIRTVPIIKEGDPREIMIIARDIRDREKLEAQLRQAQKMDAIGRLAGGIAHDFNNKLTVILGQVEFALTHVNQADSLYQKLIMIKQSAKDSADLTRQLLAFARKQNTIPKMLDLNETVSGMLSMLHRIIGEDIDLGWYPGANLWPVHLDPGQIDQILANLLVNARDAIEGIGKVTIETQNASFTPEYCEEAPGFSPGDYVMLAVSDTGHGMGKATVKQIFEPFFTTKPQGKGTGLGLSTVYGIIKQNDGFINVYSEPGEGTTFKIYFTRYEGKQEVESEQKPEGSVQRGNETILLVEDDPAILKLGTVMLNELGYEVIPANSGEEALLKARDFQSRIHLLLTDVIMPEMNGRDLADQLQSSYPAMKILFMSGYTADIIAHKGVMEEGVHFLQKPFMHDTLAQKVREILDG